MKNYLYMVIILTCIPLMLVAQDVPAEAKSSLMDFLFGLGPILALLISELMSLIPSLKANGILDFILKILNLFQKK